MTIRIPLAMPDLGGREEEYVAQAIRSSWISSCGPFISRFEQHFSELCGSRATVPVCNGTSALHLALMALGIGPGEEVLVPSLTFVASANCVRYVGATPIFVDVDPETWCLDPEQLEQAISPRTRAIIAVHLYGHPADMDRVNAFAERQGLSVIEDAAQAHGARYKGRQVGSLATLGTFSFFGNKLLTCGEGGAVTVSDPGLEQAMRLLASHGMDPARRYFFPVVGHNLRLTNTAAALLCAQLEHFADMQTARQRVYRRYRQWLADIPGIGLQPVAEWAEPAPWLFCITIDADVFGMSRDELAVYLAEQGIDTRPFFIPLHRLPPYQAAVQRVTLNFSEGLAGQGLNLPTYTGLRDAQIEEICGWIRQAHGGRRRPSRVASA